MLRTPSQEGDDLGVPLRQRLDHLPLLLAGPILRRTESEIVTVWVALKAPRVVTLKVYATNANGSIITNLLFEGTSSTVPLGQYLHIVVVTAKPIGGRAIEDAPFTLKPGQIYAYNLSFGSDAQTLPQALSTPHLPPITVSYFEHQLPTFAIPPDDLNDLRLAHGSCRKLHGGGSDALPIVDNLIEHHAQQSNSRLHQLFLTGDQIYGDDVANPLLWVATEVGDTLLGWEEDLPLYQTSTHEYAYKKPCELKPGERTDIAEKYCSFTAMVSNSPEKAQSHLFSLGEYCAAYLLSWSPLLWPERLPEGKDIYNNSKQAKQWDTQVRHIQECITQLGKVRRAMANVPTYMIFDDHDVTDDWYLNRDWCLNVLSKPLGRRVVQNAMLAYALFQGWGNTPEQFLDGKPGGNLLRAAIRWSKSAGKDQSALDQISKYLSIPELEAETGLPKMKCDEQVLILDRDYADGTQPIEWHYTIRSHKHEVVVLDTRTWRGYPQGNEGAMSPSKCSASQINTAIAPPMLLCPTAFQQQVQSPLELTDCLKQANQADIEVTFVVVPTNLVSLRIIDLVQRLELQKGEVYGSDVGDSWNLNEVALSRLLTELFQRRQMVVVLSGDIHYGATIRLSYWYKPAHQQPNVEVSSSTPQISPSNNARVLAQLTASAFKNGELKTYVVHTKAKSLDPELPQNWVGWNTPPQLVEIQITPEHRRVIDLEVPTKGPFVRQIQGVRGNGNLAWDIALKDEQSLPDWQYYIEWIKREKALLAPWLDQPISSAQSKPQKSTQWLTAVGNLISRLWRNRWVQEGEEVVGYNNFGLVSLQWHPTDDQAKAVIHDVYWQPTWNSNSVVYSRYFVSLRVNNPPPIPNVVSRKV